MMKMNKDQSRAMDDAYKTLNACIKVMKVMIHEDKRLSGCPKENLVFTILTRALGEEILTKSKEEKEILPNLSYNLIMQMLEE